MPRRSPAADVRKKTAIAREAKKRLARERKERDAEFGHLDPVARNLLEALLAAQSHLEYCGYGDSWERECALDPSVDPLDKKIEAAIAAARRQQ